MAAIRAALYKGDALYKTDGPGWLSRLHRTAGIAQGMVGAPVAAAPMAENALPQKGMSSGTVVLDVEEGGIEVPSFVGKNLRNALETAEDAGLDLNAVGSGVAREQTPAAGTRVTAGARVVVRFGR